MALPPLNDTIAAIATASGSGAIGIVRLSGPDSLAIAGTLFRPASGKRADGLPGHSATFGSVVHAGEQLDQGLLLLFRGPRSYTGQDAAEFQLHGGPAVLRDVLAACLASGARQAGPGEFTLRAYMEGRIDLAQAESVLAVVNASGAAARRAALHGLSGRLSGELDEVQTLLTRVYGNLQARLDYPDEGVEEHEWQQPLEEVRERVNRLLATARSGRLAREGARVALLGRPNAGKSSLLNALAGYDRALVSDTPGTTRDYLEVSTEVSGVRLTLVDTAGLRQSADSLEAAGVALAGSLARSADLVLHLIDPFQPAEPLPDGITAPVITVHTKADLAEAPAGGVAVSSVTGAGLDGLRRRMAESLELSEDGAELWVVTERHAQALTSVSDAVEAALAAPLDLAALDLQDALSALGTVTGRSDISGETLEHVFSQFCVGK